MDTLTELFKEGLGPTARPPLPPTRAMLEAMDRVRPPTPSDPVRAANEVPAELPAPTEVKPPKLPLRFQFKRDYDSIYIVQGQKFVLREEHLAELRRLVTEFNRHNPNRTTPLSMSDIINAALDFAFEHALNVRTLNDAEEVRDAIAKEVYRKAFFEFLRHYEMV
jgi:hypothetical protein